MQTETGTASHRIIQLEAENTKRLRAVQITPQGHLINIGGRNGQGKTSVLDAIEMALGGGRSIPEKPIRDGEQTARVVLKTEDLIITRTFSEGKSRLVVTNRDGARFTNGQQVLDALMGKLSFDPLAFTRLEPKKQAEALRDLIGLDTSELDRRRELVFNTRTDINRDVKRFQAARDRSKHHDGVGESEQSATEILASIESANESNERIRGLHNEIASRTKSIQLIDDEIGRLTKRREEEEAAREAAREACSGRSFINTEQFKDALSQIEDHNRKVRENIDHATITEQLDDATRRSDELTEEIECIDAEKAQVIREAKFPIEGLGIDDSGTVLYNDIPLAQASGAEQIRVSVAIGLAMNPTLRVLLVREGSLLDSDSLAIIEQMAAERDAQVFCERVGEGDECQVIIEDGMVKGAATGSEVAS